MSDSPRKSISKLLGLSTFLLLFLLKGAFPKPAYAFVPSPGTSSLDACARQPQCASVLGSELAPVIATPTAEGVASTITATTATGVSTTTQAAAGVAVVTAGVLATEPTANDTFIAKWHYWNQAANSRAQEIAKQRYCAAYPNDQVCNSTKISYVQGYGYRPGCLSPVFVSIQIPFGQEGNIISQADSFCGRGGVLAYYRNGGRFNDTVFAGGFSIFSTSNPPIPWKDWSQEKRSIAVAALTDSDWQGLISSMPEGGRLNPGDKANAPIIVIPGEETDDPITPQDDRLPRKERGFFTNPGSPNTDYDQDGTPDTSDPEPQNPNVPRASSDPPAPSNEPAPSEGEQEVDQVRDNYDDFLEKPENAGFRDRLNEIEEKYRRAAQMEANDPNSQEAGWLTMEAEDELAQLRNEIGEAWWSSLSQYEQQLFDGRSQADIDEMQRLMKQWDKGTFDDVAHSIVHHAPKKGYEDPLEYMRDASRFDKSQATRIPTDPNQLRNDGTVRWVIRDTGEYRIETPDGKTLTYGFDQY